MDFLSDKFALKSPPAAAGKGGEFYLPPGAPLEHVMEALDGGGGGSSEAFYGKGGKCVAQAAYNPHGRLDRASPGRDGAGPYISPPPILNGKMLQPLLLLVVRRTEAAS
ncbi:UNVERIFIED_CONTAM: hypothetical protein K2H54_073314 [Gekko kuhli]